MDKLTRGGMPGVVNAISFRSFTVERNLVLSIPGYHLGLTAHHQATHLGCFRVIPDRYILKYLRRARQSSVVRLMLLVLDINGLPADVAKLRLQYTVLQ